MITCELVTASMNMNEKLQLEDGTKKASAKSFRSLVRGLIYLAHTRADISFLVGVVSKFISNPSMHYFGATKRILCYVGRTIDYRIWYTHVSNFKVFGFINNSSLGSLDDRRSTSNNDFKLDLGAITWFSIK